ncbi:hypothetical protein KDK_60210 [Dictyobacter kobayashii]|uniref:Wadjet protein JetD C-terminal domain-containing protein n=1 Tax=Dictyobacter kobayashii TaxID=2014872 RepID=A0A402AT11_9CHLR|nr:hypothetical protein KDK_60210 [Dictyobacter kobayashii]
MDKATLSTFSEFWVTGTPLSVQRLPHLTDEEHDLFIYLMKENIRLEQERISYVYAIRYIRERYLSLNCEDVLLNHNFTLE